MVGQINQKTFLEIIDRMLDTHEIDLDELTRLQCLEALHEIQENQYAYYKEYIIGQLKREEQTLEELDYSCWYHYFGDLSGHNYEEYARELFTEAELQKIWDTEHKKCSFAPGGCAKCDEVFPITGKCPAR